MIKNALSNPFTRRHESFPSLSYDINKLDGGIQTPPLKLLEPVDHNDDVELVVSSVPSKIVESEFILESPRRKSSVMPSKKDSFDIESVMVDLISTNELESSFCIIDLTKVSRSVSTWRRHLPRMQPCFELGVNADDRIISTVHGVGATFILTSESDYLHLAKVPLSAVLIDACLARSDAYILRAGACGVRCFLVDSVEGMAAIASHVPGASVLLGMADAVVERSRSDEEEAVEAPYGITILEVEKMVESATSFGLKVKGISVPLCDSGKKQQVGEGFEDVLEEAMRSARAIISLCLAMGVGKDLDTLHFSGAALDKIASCGKESCMGLATEMLDDFFPIEDFPGLNISACSTRAFVGKCCTIATSIVGLRRGRDECMYYVDDGIYGSFHAYMVGELKDCSLVPKALFSGPTRSSDQTALSTVWGPTCDSLDRIAHGVKLPIMNVGDWLYFTEVGSFAVACGTKFNGLEAPAVIYLN